VQVLLAFSKLIDFVNERIGRALSWLVLIAVLISAINAVIRKVFSSSSNAWLELQWYLFSAVFLMCAAYTLLKNEHIRIDIVSSRLRRSTRNWIDVGGHVIFLLPLCALMLYEAWPYFWLSFVSSEHSSNAGGLIRWPAKILIVIGFAMLLAQGISELIKRIAVIQGVIPDQNASSPGPH
jgi:TRAP-type mannitol/chloroaromatic compound transport system permease small subunit